MNLSKIELKRYNRQIIIDNIGINGQMRLKKAKILIIGAGGLGCPILLYLASSGIGHIGILDYDTIDKSNLNRQILYAEKDEKILKTKAAQEKINILNSHCQIIAYNIKLNSNNSLDIIKKYDIIVDASDNFNTRYVIDFACHKLHKPHIYGAIQEFEGQICVFNYKDNLRYSSIYPHDLNLENNNNCNISGVIGEITGTIGILQATEVIKIILGIGDILNKKIINYNLLKASFKSHYITSIRDKNNKLKKSDNNAWKKSIISQYIINKLNSNKILIIDIRNKREFHKKHPVYSINIPLRYLKFKKAIEFLYNQCNKRIIILYCNNISRSIIASKFLYKNNINRHYILKEK
uniref:Molybdopterin biosynthesis protein n=1 Tax=Spyridia filamentosa TaxID=196632 RepID=A0A1Z1MKC5_SPYFI|nr:Molybdopterin biosynthesis protein [Spyridia filamentosa]ARW66292.1 Molybdopterin biosynthesis protein [Spyridia filamentosa]